MELYILRHAIAVSRGTPGYPSDDRPLTDAGVVKMKKVSKGIAQVVDEIDLVFSSPLRRAYDTAVLAGETVHFGELRKTDTLLPGSSQADLVELLVQYKSKNRVMIVGHEPDLSRFAAFLLDSSDSSLAFKKGSLCRIDITAFPPKGFGVLRWLLSPKQLRMLK